MYPMTELLYIKNIDSNYIKEFDAEVLKSKKDYILLDKTAFYPVGGGQPSDTGIIKWGITASNVIEVVKKGDSVKHIIDGEKPSVGTIVHGKIDWDKRYKLMKMHTAQHILSGIVFDEFNARTVGNQIHQDYSRVDFKPVNFTNDDLEFIKSKFNDIVSKDVSLKIYEEERESLEKRVDQRRSNMDLIPQFIRKLRIVEIEDLDICPCAGTHVKNIKEIGKIENIKRETKGKDTDRIIYSLCK